MGRGSIGLGDIANISREIIIRISRPFRSFDAVLILSHFDPDTNPSDAVTVVDFD